MNWSSYVTNILLDVAGSIIWATAQAHQEPEAQLEISVFGRKGWEDIGMETSPKELPIAPWIKEPENLEIQKLQHRVNRISLLGVDQSIQDMVHHVGQPEHKYFMLQGPLVQPNQIEQLFL